MRASDDTHFRDATSILASAHLVELKGSPVNGSAHHESYQSAEGPMQR
jgi:hypothetical protein